MTMKSSFWHAARGLLTAVALLPLAATAQTALVITNGVQTYGALTNFTITMSNRCELRVTATTNPIPSCTVNLASADAWFFLPNIRPSVVSANYLSQVLVNGAAAVAGSNCRLDEYAMGSVIVPQAPSYTPLQVFSGQNFLGSSASLALYTYYNTTAALGGMMDNISSFKLKRGYSCTFAQNADGTGASQVFVAQDGDLEVSVMPTNLDHQCSFVRVFPWRWTGKKGWVTSGNTGTLVDTLWNYDYDNVATSTLDVEYIPMRDTAYWDDYANINSKQKSTQTIGFNEPDQANQANMTVAAAIAQWPSLVQSGLRVGAPAVSSSGVSGQGPDWLYSFMNSATNLGYRVDFIPVHWYKCSQSALQFSNYLAGIYQATGRPLWVTEFNNGSSSCGNVTLAANATAISSYLTMLESCPFVERYAIYQYFDTTSGLRMTTTNSPSTLTPAGQIYHDQQSGLGYTQAMPPGGSRSIVQFQFETNTLDSSGYGNNAFARGVPGYATGHSGQAVTLDGTNSYLQLPTTIANSASFTFAAWIYWNGGNQWQRIFDFGDDTSHYLFLTPNSGSTLRFAINNGSGEQQLNAPPLVANTWVHVAVTLSGSNAKLYTNGVLAASSSTNTIVPSNFNPNLNYLGKSQFAADPLFNGKLDEVQIADTAFTAAQISALFTNSPPAFTTNFMWLGTGAQGTLYSSNISSTVTDPNPGDTQTFSKVSGPAWLSVSASGIFSGTPSYNDTGTNAFTVRVTDAAGASAFVLVNIILPNIFTNGVWNADASGSWNDTTKWSNNNPANGAGYTADFSTLNISLNRTVILDGSRSLGTLKFGDTSGAQNWTLTATNSSVLTLDTGAGTSASIVVNQNTATNFAPLAGVNGFTKSGAGTLVLATNNSFSGTLNVDTGSTTTSDGAVRVAYPSAIANATSPINIIDNNSGSSTLQLDGTAGNITVAQDIALNGRSASVVSIENLAGTNTLAGALTINVGGANYWIQSDAGLLTLSGLISSVATGARTFTFQGNGGTTISGALTNGSATVSLTKSGAGALTLLGNNSYSGTTTISGGTLQVGNGGANGTLGTNNVVNSGTLMFNSSAAVVAPITISGSGNLAKLGSGTLTFSNANSYTGGTLLAQGIIQVNNNSVFGTGTITNDSGANNARILLGNGVTVTNSFVANTVNPSASTGLIMVNDNTSATFTGPITILTNAASGGHFYGPFTTGLLSITGPIKSGVTNFLVIRAGNVRFSGGGNYFEIQPRANTASLGANNGLATNAAVDLAGNGSTTVPTILDLNGFNQTLSGLKNSVNNTFVAWVTNSSATTNTLTLDLNSGATNAQSFGGSVIGGIAITLASGTQTFTKTGASALNGLYTYSGNTTLNGGKLILGSGITLPNTPQISLAAGAVLDASAVNLNLGAAQTLKGSGALIGALAVNGIITPGNGIGALSVTGAVTLASGGKYISDIGNTTDSPGVNNDFVYATSTLTVSATSGSPFIIKPVASALAGWNNQTNYSWTLATGSGVSSFAANKFSVDTSAFANNLGGGSLVVAQTGNSLTLNFVPNIVPIQFTNAVFIGGGAFKLAATGVPGNPYSLWSATNLASPINWLLSASTNADTNGLLNFSDALATNSPQKFYRLSSP